MQTTPVPLRPTLFLPGLLCTSEVFAPQLEALWPLGPVAVANTLEGRTISEVASAILRDAPPRFDLAGISMGGYLCFEILRQAPGRVSGLALIDTSAQPDTAEQIAGRRALLARAEAEDYLEVATQALAFVLHPSRRDDPVLRDINLRMAQTIGLAGLEQQLNVAISRPDSRSLLPEIAVPTVVIVGDSDLLTPLERSEEIASLIPGARLVVIPECGHGSTLERPAEVNHALLAWKRRAVSSSR